MNSFGLPHGLLLTGILTPVFYLWLFINKKRYTILKFFLVLSPFAIVHFFNGVNFKYYVTSTVLLFTAYIFTYTFKTFIEKTLIEQKKYLEELFLKFTSLNFLLTLIAIVLYFTPYWDWVWIRNSVSDKLHNFPRLAMFTYEPSYYSTLLVPIFLFYLACFMEHPHRKYIKLLLIISLSLILSFALGVLASIFIAVVLLVLFKFKHLLKKRKFVNSITLIFISVILILIFLAAFYPDNPLFLRVTNIFSGRDSSGKGRTVEAFILSYKIAQQKSLIWGAGLGQIKEVGDSIIRSHYNYSTNEIPVVTIPNAVAETLAIFGFFGLSIRIFVQIFLFFKTKVSNSSYRLMLFLYIFIYQFTGSYITNIAEYIIWILAFVPYFNQFEKNSIHQLKRNNLI